MTDEFLVRIDFPAQLCSGRLGGAKRLGIADQHDRERSGNDRLQIGEAHLRETEGRQPRLLRADDPDPLVVQIEDDHGDDGQHDGGQSRRNPREKSFECEQHNQARKPHDRGREVCIGQLPDQVPQLLEKIAVAARDAEELRHLTDHGDPYQALNETLHGGFGNEVGDPTHAQQTEDQKEHTHRHGQRGSQRHKIAGALRGQGTDRHAGDEGGRRVGPDDHGPRGAEDRVGNQRQGNGIQPDEWRDFGNAGVGHGSRDQNGPYGQPGDNVVPQPRELVLWQPFEDGQISLQDARLPTAVAGRTSGYHQTILQGAVVRSRGSQDNSDAACSRPLRISSRKAW